MVEVKNAISPPSTKCALKPMSNIQTRNMLISAPTDHRVPDEGRNAGFDAVEPHPPVFEEIVVLAESLGM
jgi:hypothetical protein